MTVMVPRNKMLAAAWLQLGETAPFSNRGEVVKIVKRIESLKLPADTL